MGELVAKKFDMVLTSLKVKTLNLLKLLSFPFMLLHFLFLLYFLHQMSWNFPSFFLFPK